MERDQDRSGDIDASIKFGNLIGSFVGWTFVCIGIGAVMFLYWNLWDAYRTSGWQETPCLITHSSLERHRGDKSTTYRATAEYEYEFEGQAYNGTRVGIHSLSDNFGSWQRDMAGKLKQACKSRTPMTGFVNPADPSQALLDRDLRFGPMMLGTFFAFLFSVIGGAFATYSSGGGKKPREPGRPWTVRSDWALGVIKSAPISGLKSLLLWTILMVTVAIPIGTILPRELQAGNWVAYCVLAFPVIIVSLLLACVHTIWRQLAEGTTEIQMAATPGVIGGPLTGVIQTRRDLRSSTSTRMSLRCIETETYGSGKHTHTDSNTIWEKSHEIVADLKPGIGDGSAIPFDFQIPYGLPQSGGDNQNGVRWVLQAASLGKGPSFQCEVDMPVFYTNESTEDAQASSLLDEYKRDVSPEATLAGFKVRVVHDTEVSRRLRIPGQRSFRGMVTFFLWTFAFVGATIGIFGFDGPWPLGIITGLVSLILVPCFLHTLCWGCRITSTPETATLRSGATVFCGTKVIPTGNFDHLEIDNTTTANNKRYYEIFIGSPRTPSVRVGKGILGKENAESYARALWDLVVRTDPPEVTTRKDQFQERKKRRKRGFESE